MSPHDVQVAALAWISALVAIIAAVGVGWATVYPVLSRLRKDIDALWAAHRAEGGGGDGGGTGVRGGAPGAKGDGAGRGGGPVR